MRTPSPRGEDRPGGGRPPAAGSARRAAEAAPPPSAEAREPAPCDREHRPQHGQRRSRERAPGASAAAAAAPPQEQQPETAQELADPNLYVGLAFWLLLPARPQGSNEPAHGARVVLACVYADAMPLRDMWSSANNLAHAAACAKGSNLSQHEDAFPDGYGSRPPLTADNLPWMLTKDEQGDVGMGFAWKKRNRQRAASLAYALATAAANAHVEEELVRMSWDSPYLRALLDHVKLEPRRETPQVPPSARALNTGG